MQVQCAWPCFHHKQEGSPNGQKVHLTNVRPSPSCMAVLSSQTGGELKQTNGPPHKCTGKSIVHGCADIKVERGTQTHERSSSPNSGQVHRAWPCFHQSRKGNSYKRKVLLTNVWASSLCLAAISSQTRGKLKQTKAPPHHRRASPMCMAVLPSQTRRELEKIEVPPYQCTAKCIVHGRAFITDEKEIKQTKGPPHQCMGKSIVHGCAFINVERGTQTDERSTSPVYGLVHCAWPRFHHKREGSSDSR